MRGRKNPSVDPDATAHLERPPPASRTLPLTIGTDGRTGGTNHTASDSDLVAPGVVGRIGRDLVAALLACEMEAIGVLFELRGRLEALTALPALEI
jgi:hypothetical protein